MIWSEREFEEVTAQQPAPLDFSTAQAGEGSEHEGKAPDQHPAPLPFDDVQSEVSEMRGRADEKADNSGTECAEKTEQEVNVDGEGRPNHR